MTAKTSKADRASPDAVDGALRELLKDGQPLPANHVKAAIHQAGAWPWRSVHRAAQRIGVKIEKTKGSLTGGWQWALPKMPQAATEDASDSEAPVFSGRVRCADCRHLKPSNGRCKLAHAGQLPSVDLQFKPEPHVLRRCAGFAPRFWR
jgi:hypothetical protein